MSAGRNSEALAAVAEALSMTGTDGDRWHEAELRRLNGEIPLTGPDPQPAAAEACLRQALEVARSQEAKPWELRTAVTLARLWQDQGRTEEARDLLAPVYDWFTEGFDTADLKDAKAMK